MHSNRQFQPATFKQISFDLKAFHSLLFDFYKDFRDLPSDQTSVELFQTQQNIMKDINKIFDIEKGLRQRVEFFDYEPEPQKILLQSFESIMNLPACCMKNCQQQAKRKSTYQKRVKLRGPYRSYSNNEKNHVVSLHQNGMTFAKISKLLEIPQKNIVRWCKEGYIAKDVSKRVADHNMEKSLFEWIAKMNHSTLKHWEIQEKAKALSANPEFKASRGWLKNFLKRYEADKAMKVEVKQEYIRL